MARTRTARRDEISFQASELFNWFGVHFLEKYLSERVLRRLIPFLLILFFIVLVIGVLAHFTHGRQVAVEDAPVPADVDWRMPSRPTCRTPFRKHSDWQNRLAEALLPAPPSKVARFCLLMATARSGGGTYYRQRRRAYPAGYSGSRSTRYILGSRAGVVRITLPDGTESLVTVRNIPGSEAQVALIQPLNRALTGWRRVAAVGTSLSLTSGILLLLLGASFSWLSERALARRIRALCGPYGSRRRLRESGTGVVGLERRARSCRLSQSANDLFGRRFFEPVLPYREIAGKIHSADDLLGAVKDAIPQGRGQFRTAVSHEAEEWAVGGDALQRCIQAGCGQQ